MNVRLVGVTKPLVEGIKTAEEFIVYCARVSNPENQLNTDTAENLIKYLIKHKHWSPFEMVDVAFEIQTSRSIAAQILRHRSFSFQEFSQRYSSAVGFEGVELRKQATKNRQSSEDVINDMPLNTVVNLHLKNSFDLYKDLLRNGVSRETAREILPLNTKTTLYMKGSLRSWIHYIQVRDTPETQKEHRVIAQMIKHHLQGMFLHVFNALASYNSEQ